MNQNIGTSIIFCQLNCFDKYPPLHITIARKPLTVPPLPFPPVTSAFVMSTTPPSVPILAMLPTLMYLKLADLENMNLGKGSPTGAATMPGGGSSESLQGSKLA